MNKKVGNTLKFLAFLILGLGLLFLAFRGIEFHEMIDILRNAKYSWVLLSLVFGVISHISRSRRWNLLIHPLGYKPSLLNTFSAVMFGYLANYTIPRAGEVARCVSLGRKEKIPVDKLIGTVIVERTIDMISLLIIMIILLITRFEKFGTFFNDYIFKGLSDKINGASLLLVILGSGVLLSLLVFFVFKKKIMELKIAKKVLEIVKGVIDGLKTILKMQRRWEFFLQTLLVWGCYAMMTWVVVFSFEGITDHLLFADGIFLLVIGSFGMVVPVSAGIGAFHWIVSRGLHFVYGLDLNQGVAFATLQHTSQTLMVIFLSSLSLIVLFSGKNKKIKAHPVR